MSMMRVGSFKAVSHSLKKDLGGICLKRFAPNAALQPDSRQYHWSPWSPKAPADGGPPTLQKHPA